MELEAGVHDVERVALGEELGHGDLLHGVLALDEAPQRVVGQAAAGVDCGGEVDELVADRLVAGERPAEGLALAREGERAVEGALHAGRPRRGP